MGLNPDSRRQRRHKTSQVTEAGTRICAVLPLKASPSVISMLYLRSEPRSLELHLPAAAAAHELAEEDESKILDMEAEKSVPKP